jgi:hypothetical protein
MKLRGGVNKFVLRRAAEALLPGLVDRGKKAFYFSVAAMFPEVYAAWLDTVLTGGGGAHGACALGLRAGPEGTAAAADPSGEKQLLSLVCFVEWHDRYLRRLDQAPEHVFWAIPCLLAPSCSGRSTRSGLADVRLRGPVLLALPAP